MTQVFISYSRKDLTFVERLAEDLKASGLEVWYDLSGLDGGTRWGREIQSAIQQSQFFIVVLSPNSVESDWVEKEFMYAYHLKRKIVPLLYQPCDPPIWFINLHFIDVQETNYERHFPIILKALDIKPGEAAKRMEPAVVVPAVQEPLEIQKPLPPAVEQEEQKPTLLQTEPPAGQEPTEEGKALQHKKLPREKQKRSRREMKVRPAWILIPAGLVAVIVFAVWGMPQMKAWLAPPPIPTMTAMHTPTPTRTYTLLPTKFYTPTLTRTSSPSPTPRIGSKWTSPVDNMVMVYVPEGDFSMGSDNIRLDERPVHTVYLDAFWIDQTEVTNRMYALCVAEGACQPPTNSSSRGRSSYYGNPEFDNYPVTYVGWNMAEAYCRWAGRRLLTEAEWEKAARGTDGRTYPWGNSPPTCTLASLPSLGYGKSICVEFTTAVGSYPAGASPYGALDMAGNVWEWVNDWYSGTYYSQSPASNPTGPASGDYRVLRGVSWGNNVDNVRSAYRFGGNPTIYSSPYVLGFRCSRSP